MEPKPSMMNCRSRHMPGTAQPNSLQHSLRLDCMLHASLPCHAHTCATSRAQTTHPLFLPTYACAPHEHPPSPSLAPLRPAHAHGAEGLVPCTRTPLPYHAPPMSPPLRPPKRTCAPRARMALKASWPGVSRKHTMRCSPSTSTVVLYAPMPCTQDAHTHGPPLTLEGVAPSSRTHVSVQERAHVPIIMIATAIRTPTKHSGAHECLFQVHAHEHTDGRKKIKHLHACQHTRTPV